MKKTLFIVLAVLLLTATVYALPSVYEIPTTVEIAEDAYGSWQVPCIGTRSPLYTSPGVGQDVIDAENSALIYKYGKGYTIIDHAGSEMNGGHIWAVEDMQVGCGGFLCREGKPEKCYECTAIYLAQQNTNGYWYHGKKIVPDSNAIICVSCTDTDGWVYVAYFEFVGEMP